MANGIMFKIEERQQGIPEIISEETFMLLLTMQDDDTIPPDIEDVGWEDEDIDGDDFIFI